MDDNLLSQLEELRLIVTELEAVSRKALGFVGTIRYKEILFNLRPASVIPDLSPLAYFDLVEYIDNAGAEAATVRLYDQLFPLLSCRHQWTEPKGLLDRDGKPIMYESLQYLGHIFICELCTACAIETPEAKLPTVGRTVESIL